MLAFIPAIILALGAFAVLILQKSRYSKYIALAFSLIALISAVVIFISPQQVQSFAWFKVFGFTFQISSMTFLLNRVLLLLVSIITPLVFTYSIGYMDLPGEQNRFYFEMCLFAAAMMLFAIAGDLITMFIGWEFLGITSYLLIGFRYHKERAPYAARKAITTIAIGDVAFIIAIVIIYSHYQTTSIQTLLALHTNTDALTIALIFILIAAFTKSAQFPFNEWLADAMEGPTPVSSFLHSSTMVKAGVFLIAVLLPLYMMANLLPVILIFGIITAVLAVMNALSEYNMKRVLAYSTMEDLALMFVALGLGSVYAALFLFIVQTFYKALLFMGAGYIIKANDDNEELYNAFNSGTNKIFFISMVIGVLSIAGFIPFGGFFGKAAIDTVAENTLYVYVILLVLDLLSSIYIFRWLLVPARKRVPANSVETSYKLMPKSMMIPVVVLAVLVALSGLTFYFINSQFPSSVANFTLMSLVLLIVTSVAGFLVAYKLYAKRKAPDLSIQSRAYKLIHNSILVNYFYYYFTVFFTTLGEMFYDFDYALDRTIASVGKGAVAFGNLVKRIENGNVNVYAVTFMLGAILLILIFVLLTMYNLII